MWFAFRRLFGREDWTVPSVCYDTCNNAYLEGQAVMTPARCAPGSAFFQYYDACVDCSLRNSNDTKLARNYLSDKFGQFCHLPTSLNTATLTLTVPPTTSLPTTTITATSITIPTSWLTVGEARVTTELYGLDGDVNKTITMIVETTGTRSDWTGFSHPPSRTSTPEHSSGKTSNAWIVGPVVGSVAGVCLVGLGTFFYLRRRSRTQKAANPELEGDTEWKSGDKPQLHSDSMPIPEYHELHGSGPDMLEMAANETAAMELPGDKSLNA